MDSPILYLNEYFTLHCGSIEASRKVGESILLMSCLSPERGPSQTATKTGNRPPYQALVHLFLTVPLASLYQLQVSFHQVHSAQINYLAGIFKLGLNFDETQ